MSAEKVIDLMAALKKSLAESAPKSLRDPRLDPRPGDVVQTARGSRTVVARVGPFSNVKFVAVSARGNKWADTIFIHSWKRWARKGCAEVVSAAGTEGA